MLTKTQHNESDVLSLDPGFMQSLVVPETQWKSLSFHGPFSRPWKSGKTRQKTWKSLKFEIAGDYRIFWQLLCLSQLAVFNTWAFGWKIWPLWLLYVAPVLFFCSYLVYYSNRFSFCFLLLFCFVLIFKKYIKKMSMFLFLFSWWYFTFH